jgi:predicted enzyme related to lactoylglutathione lyase
MSDAARPFGSAAEETDDDVTGRVVHFELPVDDLDRAQRFYEAVFDWRIRTEADLGYTTATTGPTHDDGPLLVPGFVNGGLVLREEAASDAALVVVDVADIDATLDHVEAAGGKPRSGRRAVGAMGWAAVVEDSEGNVLGLWQTASI